MENKRWIPLIGLCLAAALGGYLLANPKSIGLGRAPLVHPEQSINQRSGPETGLTRTFTPAAVKERSPEQLVSLKKHIIALFAGSPSGAHDWALRSQVEKMLATMTAAELEKFAAELAPAPNTSRSTEDWPHALQLMVCRAWGLKDPANCLKQVKWAIRESVFSDWLTRDPKAAEDWLSHADFPPGMENVEEKMRLSLLKQQALTDFASARKSLASLDPKTRQSTLQGWASMFANDAEKRTELLAFLATLPDQEAAESAYQSMIAKMAGQSPHDAAMFIETMNLSEEAKDRLSHQMIGKWALDEPVEAFNAWLEIGETKVPKPFYPALDRWSLNSPGAEEAINWVNGIQPGPAKEQFKSHMIDYYSMGDRYAQAAELGRSLVDPKERILQMKIVMRKWEARGGIQKARANDWLSKLPPEDRAAVEKPLE